MKSIIQKFGIVAVFLLTFLQSAADIRFTVDGVSYLVTHSKVNGYARNEVSITHVSETTASGHYKIPSGVFNLSTYYTVTKIGTGAFKGCSELTSIEIPNTITDISGNAFFGCTKLSSVEIPNSVETIGDHSFANCPSIKSIVIGSGLYKIGECAFVSSNIESISVVSSNPNFDSRNNCNAIIQTIRSYNYSAGPNTLILGCKNTKIPENVESIGSYSFYGCHGLYSLTIPESVINIWSYAFKDCADLTNLTIPRSVKTISTSLISNSGPKKLTILSTAFEQSYGWRFLETVPKDVEIVAYKSQTEPIRKYWNGTLTEMDDIIQVNNIATDLSTCKFNVNSNLYYDVYSVDNYIYGDIAKNENEYTITRLPQNYEPEIIVEYIDKSTNRHFFHRQYVGITKQAQNNTNCKLTCVDRTQTTITFKIDYNNTVSKWGILDENHNDFSGKGNNFPNSKPQDRYITVNKEVWANDGSGYDRAYVAYVYDDLSNEWYISDILNASNKDLNLFINQSDNYAFTLNINYGWEKGDADIRTQSLKLDNNRWFDADAGGHTTFSNLEPDSKHTIQYRIYAYGNSYTISKDFTVHGVKWSDGVSIALSTTSARLKYGVNLPDDAVGTGFEWRRIDAPDLVASSTVGCICVDGYLVGTLNNLNPDVYYKFRPFYKSPATGTTYYGDWVGIFTGDATVFFEPEIITSLPQVKETSATLHGYAIQGTETIKAQGFEYRAVGSTTSSAVQSQWIQMPSTDANMVVELSDLKPGYTYEYRGYATTATQTYYSPVQQFTTIEQSGVSDVVADEFTVDVRSTGDEVFVNAQNAPTDVRCIIYNINGSVMAEARIECSDDWTSIANLRRGIYILQAVSGDAVQTKRFIVR